MKGWENNPYIAWKANQQENVNGKILVGGEILREEVKNKLCVANLS